MVRLDPPEDTTMKSLVWLVLWVLATPSAAFGEVSRSQVAELVTREDCQAISHLGAPGLETLAELYSDADRDGRVRIANIFYWIGRESPAAAQALEADIHTDDVDLRISAQYALGRVSGDDRVVQVLLENMRQDPNPLLRDKAACALAYDQIHLTERQKVRLFAGLIQALQDDEPQVRKIAIKALKIHTGQTKGFQPGAAPELRREAVVRWQRWLLDYRRSL